MSGVTCQKKIYIYIFFFPDKVVELVGGGSVNYHVDYFSNSSGAPCISDGTKLSEYFENIRLQLNLFLLYSRYHMIAWLSS